MLLEREAFLEILVLWGGCDPLNTPRPLGPLLDVADTAGGDRRTHPGTRRGKDGQSDR